MCCKLASLAPADLLQPMTPGDGGAMDVSNMSKRPDPNEPEDAEFSTDMGIQFLGMIDGAMTLQLDLLPKHMSYRNI